MESVPGVPPAMFRGPEMFGDPRVKKYSSAAEILRLPSGTEPNLPPTQDQRRALLVRVWRALTVEERALVLKFEEDFVVNCVHNAMRDIWLAEMANRGSGSNDGASSATKLPLVGCLQFTRTNTQPPRYVDLHMSPAMLNDDLLDAMFVQFPGHLSGRTSLTDIFNGTPPQTWAELQVIVARVLDYRLIQLLEKASLEPRKKKRRRRRKKGPGDESNLNEDKSSEDSRSEENARSSPGVQDTNPILPIAPGSVSTWGVGNFAGLFGSGKPGTEPSKDDANSGTTGEYMGGEPYLVDPLANSMPKDEVAERLLGGESVYTAPTLKEDEKTRKAFALVEELLGPEAQRDAEGDISQRPNRSVEDVLDLGGLEDCWRAYTKAAKDPDLPSTHFARRENVTWRLWAMERLKNDGLEPLLENTELKDGLDAQSVQTIQAAAAELVKRRDSGSADSPQSLSHSGSPSVASTASELLNHAVGAQRFPSPGMLSSQRNPARFNRGFEGVFESPVHMPEKAPSLLWLPSMGPAMGGPAMGPAISPSTLQLNGSLQSKDAPVVAHVAVQTDESEVESQYKKRIAELEARVAELEAKWPELEA
jgi:hypothetical protein